MNTGAEIWQIMAVTVILIACLVYMVVSIRRRFKDKKRSGACTGCTLIKVCKKPEKVLNSDSCKQ